MNEPDNIQDIGFDPGELPPRRGKRPSVVAHPRALDAERRSEMRAELAHVKRQVDDIGAAEIPTSQRIEKLLAINSTIIINLLKEALGEHPDIDRAVVLRNALSAVKDTASILKSKHEMDSLDTFNPRSPKFGVVFGWFIELVHRVLALHVEDAISAGFFNDLVGELSGWEDRIERQFKGVSGRAIASLQSPFIEGFKEKLGEATAKHLQLEQLEGEILHAEERIRILVAEHQHLKFGGLDEVRD